MATHKLSEENCYDCHAVGGAKDMIIQGTRLIKKDARMVEIVNGGWSSGHLPCIYCHDDSTIRTNKVGVKNHFSDYSLSKHPVDPFISTDIDTQPAVLDCVDCHQNVPYVTGGANPLNPNIHGVDTTSISWTGSSALPLSSTLRASPYNSDNNQLCRDCHETGTLFTTTLQQHSFTSSGVVSLEGSSFTTTVDGCLSTDGSPTGCHDVHNSADNVSLITLKKSDGTKVQADDCGICHTFDDPPSNRSASDFYSRGHGRFQATNNIECTSCHDSTQEHFNQDGTITGQMLSFFVASNQNSDLASPAKSLLSNCVSSNCHADKAPHGGTTYQVGCLDCHDPHGAGVGGNITMVRNTVPVASPAGSLYYGTTGAYFDSSFMGTTSYSNWLCDNQDCHSLGPGPIAVIMDTTTGTHTGGVGYTGNCGACHSHDDTSGSFGASNSCTTCHGQPPVANYGGGPDGFATGYFDSGHFKQENNTPHGIHAGPSGYGYNCTVCHVHGPDSAYHDTLAGNPQSFRNVVFDTALNPNALAEGPSKYSPSYSISAATPNVCLNLYCHGDGQGIDRYNTAVVADQAWDSDTGTTLSCEQCHGSNRTDVLGSRYFGAPDYPNGAGGAGDATYAAGSGVLDTETKANSHADTTKHGRYNCSVCHYDTIRDTDPADGWSLFDKTQHIDRQIDVAFDSGVVTGTWDSTSRTCSAVWCHNGVNPQWGDTTTCTSCHNNGVDSGLLSDAAPLSGEHADHIANSVYVGNCESCHGTEANTGAHLGHVNQSATFASQVSAYDATLGTCTNNCHAVVDGRDWTSGTTLDCVDCHNGGGTLVAGGVAANIDSANGPSTGRHGTHLASDFFVAGDCADCHGHKGGPSATVPTHINGPTVDDITMAAQVGTFYADTGGCINTCHLVDAASAGDWLDSPADLSCTDCHNATGLRLERGWPPDQGQHLVHRGNAAYVDSGVGDCVDCHNDNNAPNDHSTLDSVVTSPVLGTSVSAFNGTDNTCVNVCHLAGDTDEWLSGALLCTDCHSGTYVGGGSNAPASGLHAVSGTDANDQAFVAHDETLSAGRCANCHTATPSASHMDAVFDTPAATFASTISWAYDGTDSQSFCLGETTGCHVDGARLYRLWSSDADCTICHGKDSSASIGGYEAPASDGGSNTGPYLYGHTSVATNTTASTTDHSACDTCHWGTGSTDTGVTDHVDRGAISATLDVGYNYSRTTGKCGTNCHGGNGDTWLWQYTSSIPLNAYTTALPCGDCHNDNGLPPTSGSHTAHLSAIAGSATGTGANTDYTECETCHGQPLGGSWDAGGYPHQNGSVAFASSVTYSGGTTGTCSTDNCHSDATNQSTWGTASSVACDECHYWESLAGVPTSGENSAHFAPVSADHGNHFDASISVYCTDCHGALPADSTHIHASTAAGDGGKLIDRANAVPDEATITDTGYIVVSTDWNDGNDTCSNSVCHDPSGTGYAATWQTSTAGCALCHADTAGDPATGSHTEHMAASALYGKSVACSDCHTIPAATDHRDASVDFALAGTGYNGSAGTPFTTAFGTCTTTDCHNDGTGTAVTTSAWGTTLSDPNCGICHSDSPVSASHNQHLTAASVFGISPDCTDCHAATSSVSMAGQPGHIDDVVTMAAEAASYTGDTTVGGSTYGTCGTNNCHNSGKNTAPYNDGNASYNWGDSLADCRTCHGSAAADSNASEAHPAHVSHPTVVCSDCHTSETAATHVNQNVNVAARAASYSGDLGINGITFGTCDSGACHDAATDIAWDATPANCTQCHVNSSDSNNFDGRDKDASVIGSGEWAAVGHSAKGIVCLDCHSMGQGHDFSASLNGGNAFRLNDTIFVSGQGCSDPGPTGGCHDGTPTAFVATVKTHSASVMNSAGYSTRYTWPFDPECLNCHDPHGDGANAVMAQRELYGEETGTFSPTGTPPAQPTEQNALVFTDRLTGLSSTQQGYADYTGFDSMCQECHTQPSGFLDDTSANYSGHPGWSGATSDNPGDCSDCHKHDSGFMPSGCSGCHGGGTLGTDADNYWPDGSTVRAENTPETGRHLTHITALALEAYGETISQLLTDTGTTSDEKQKQLCAYCHEDPQGSSFSPGLHFNGVRNVTGYIHPLWQSYSVDFATADGDAVYNTGADTCATVDCHNNKLTADGTYGWYDADAAIACVMCHTDVTSGATATGLTHTNHTGAAASFGRDINCDDCHDAATAWGAPGTMPAAGHLSGAFTVSGSATFTYSGYTYPTVKGTCGTNECHNDGRSGPPWTSTYAWGDTIEPDCTECHGDDAASMTTSSHNEHLGAAGTFGIDTIDCSDCHSSATAGSHINGGVTMAAEAAAYDGDTTLTGAPFGTCGTNVCHNAGDGVTAPVNNSYTWSQSLGDCVICHSNAPSSGSHSAHISTRAYGPNPAGSTNCQECHAANTNNTSMAGYTSHIDTDVDFAVGGTLSGTTSCETCHGGAAPSATAKSNWPAATRVTCESCHGQYTQAVVDGGTAPDVYGSPTDGYGAAEKGHNLTSGNYTGGNTAAALACTGCHDNTKPHIDGVNGDSFADTDLRMLDSINSQTGFSVVEDVCGACHQNSGGSTINVANHGNVNGTFTGSSLHDGQAESFGYRCDACHEPHGMTLNGRTATSSNIFMVRGDVEVMNYSTPGASATTTDKISMIFEATTGTESFDDGATQNNNVCVQCHQNNPRPNGTGTTMASVDGDHTGLDDYSNNEQGNNCVACHQHDLDGNTASADGFMPLSCDGCHDYPPTSGMHSTHVGSYSFDCSDCHQNSGLHNGSGVATAASYAALDPVALSNEIDVVFSGANTGATYAPAKGSRVALGVGTCNGLYCHGDQWTLSAGGTDTTPAWNDTTTGSCGDCHSVTDPGTNSHTRHLTTGIAGGFGCSDCHTAGTPASGTHVTGYTVNFTGAAINYNGTVDTDNSAGLGSCGTNQCHNDGKDQAPAAYSWGTTIAGLNSCTECHGDTPITGSHTPHVTTSTGGGIGCSDCHEGETLSSHLDAAITFTGEATGYDGGTVVGDGSDAGTCGINQCHNDGKNQAAVTVYSWGTTIGGVGSCTECHDATAGTQATQSHDEHLTGSVQFGRAIDCVDCHTGAAVASHMDASVGITAALTYGGGVAVTDTSFGGCGTNTCHTDGRGDAPRSSGYAWGTSIEPDCTECHGDDATSMTTSSHNEHLNASGTFGITTIDCDSCHGLASEITHINGGVTLAAASSAYTGDTTLTGAPFGTCGVNACHDDGTGSAVNTPGYTWSTAYGDCVLCHNNVPSSGNHTDHLSAVYGPGFVTDCGACHASNGNNTAMGGYPSHIDGSVQFANVDTTVADFATLGATAPTVDPDGADTDRCTACHSSASVNGSVGAELAKSNWATSTYTLPCMSCHNGTDAGNSQANGSGIGAPDVTGDDTNYGAEVTGHTRSSGSYLSGNTGANRACTECHDASKPHIDGVNGNAFTDTDLRFSDSVNGISLVSAVQPEEMCHACHQQTGDDNGSSWKVSSHGNVNAAFKATTNHDANAETFTYRCNACHEPHGMVLNTNSNPNVYMVKPLVEIRNHSNPASTNETTNVPVIFEARTGTNSFDDGNTQGDNVCVVCHMDAANPGSGTPLTNPNGDGSHASLDNYTQNEQGNNCTACHPHNYDSDAITTHDGFMPQQCNACHSYPGLTTTGADHILSASHEMHAGSMGQGASVNYGFPCETCHYGFSHNESLYTDNDGWVVSSIAPNVDIRFDPYYNPSNGNGPSYAGSPASAATAPGVGGTGACAGLNCHGNDAANQSDWAGSDETPAWDSAAKTCGSCHADPPASGAHELHTNVTADTGRDDCVLCHSSAANYASIDADHINGTPGVADVTGVGYAGQTGASDNGYCTAACHDSGVGNDPWNDGELDCDACHYWEASPSDTANTAHPMTISELSHNGHLDTGNGRTFVCVDCHADNAGDGSGATAGVTLSHISDRTGATDAARITGMATAVQDEAAIDTTGTWINTSAWNDTNNTCANVCHNPSDTTYVSAQWGSTMAGCTSCHSSSDPSTGSHTAHLGAQPTYGKAMGCGDCHVNNTGQEGHLQGTVNFALSGTGYNGSPAGLPYGAPWSTCTTETCHNDGTGTAVTTSSWGTSIADPSCGICHAQTPSTGQHTTHLSAVYGPTLDPDCGACHDANNNKTSMNGQPSHIDGTVDFADAATLSATTGCDTCHSSVDASTAKGYWPQTTGQWLTDGGYCEHCHDVTGSVIQTVTAPNVDGRASSGYGAAITGHGAAGTDKGCTVCHDNTKPHIDGVNGTSVSDTDLRLQDTINSVDVSGATVVEDVCQACHQNTGGDAGSQVATHGNTNAAFNTSGNNTHDPNAEPFAFRCDACHEPHGLTMNTNGNPNIAMLKGSVEVMNYSVPGAGSNDTALISMVFEATTGTDSFDDGSTQGNNVCVQCHQNNPRPSGTTTTMASVDGDHTGLDAYSNNEQGNNCTSCHQHDYDSDVSTVDGFMPLQCDGCHGYPPTSNAHTRHVTSSPTGYGYNCNECHSGNAHNESSILNTTQYAAAAPTVISNNIDIGFDATNPSGSYAPAKGSRLTAGSGTCSVLYCHGNESAGDQSDWAGSDEAPAWNSGVKFCGSCHADPPASGAHALHANTNGGSDRSDCDRCHTGASGYATPTASHVNETTNVLQGYTGQTAPATPDGYCATNVCHDSAGSPGDGYWSDTALDCDACHYWAASPSDTGNTAHSRTISELSHNGHLATGNGRTFACVDCHTDNGSDTSPLTHVTSGSGADSSYYYGRAVPSQDEATIPVTSWIASGAFNDTTDTCANACHNPSGTTFVSTAWGTSSASCSFCHEDTAGDPGTGSHTAHVSVAGTFGINTIGCASCHPDNGIDYGHMDEAVDVSVTAPGYAGTVTAPWGTTFGTCTTSDCHNDGTGSAVQTPAWGTSSADCSICHAASPATLNHGVHLGASASFGVVVDCTACHDAAASDSMLGKTTHIDGDVTMAGAASAYDGTTTVGDGGAYGSCLTNGCHNDGLGQAPYSNGAGSYAWGGTIEPDCETCHRASPVTNSHDEHLAAAGTFGVSIGCGDCHTSETLASHMNGSVSLTDKASGYDTTVVVGDGTYGSCGTNDCHNDGKDTGPNTSPYNWGSVIADCTECHADEPVTGSHTPHLATSTGGGLGCADCHTAASVATHVNRTINLVSQAAGYTSGVSVGDGSDTGTCGINQCHNDGKNGSPVTTPYNWGTGIGGTNSCTECHNATAGTQATQSHDEHLNASGTFGITIDCVDCHTGATLSSHMDASVTLSGEALTYVGGTSVTDTNFGGCATNACHNAGDGSTAPVASGYAWGDSLTDCATCHAASPTTVSHPTHLSAVYGPQLSNCTDCHDSQTLSSHINAAVTFTDGNEVTPGGIGGDGSVTACDTCHSSADASTAKGYWNNAAGTWLAAGGYCEHCHDSTGSVIQGVTAPNMMGSPSLGYGSSDTGHSKPSGNYASGNIAADKGCIVCHDEASSHIDGSDGTGFGAHRMDTTINSIGSISTVEGVCDACHQNSGGDQGTQVARHGNSSAGGYSAIEGAMTAIDCGVCHEVHGLVYNGSNANMSMFRYDLTSSSFSGTRNVVLTSRTGADSFDENTGDSTNADQRDDACATCHINDANNTTLVRHTTAPAGGGIHENNSTYTGDERDKNCVACHPHNYDNDPTTADAFMPQQCNACHSYPGLDTADSDHILGGAHAIHAGSSGSGGPANYGFPCETCHFSYNHNQSVYADNDGWGAGTVDVANVNIRFNVSYNPSNANGPSYAGSPASAAAAPGVGGTGSCAGLNCHGNDAANQSDWAGSDTTPAWDSAAKSCGSCHADPPSSGAHELHTNVTADTGRDDCVLCHSSAANYASIDADHINGTPGVADVTGVGYAGQTGASDDGYCTAACHDSGVSNDPWNDGELDCDACHYWEASPSDTANTAHPMTISELSHNGHLDTGNGRTFVCVDCHADNAGDGSGATAGVTLSHISDRTGVTDAARITGMAAAVQDEAAIDTTGTWITASAWNDTNNTCANVCHNPSGTTFVSTAWGTTSASCSFCHEGTAGDPGTGSHTAHVSVAGTFGINTITCASCHPDNGTDYGHMDETVDVTVTAPGYAGTLTAPWGTTFGTCTTSDCHNDGTGSAVETPAWGTSSADCTICHAATPSQAHGAHLAHPTVDCTDCHSATSETSMAGQVSHINGTVDMAAKASAYSGTVTVGDGGAFGTCDTGACHDAATDIAWDASPSDCADCHYNSADVNNFNGQDETASVISDTEWSSWGHSAQGIDCFDCHDISGTAHDFSAGLDSTTGNPFRLSSDFTSGTGCNTQSGCHGTVVMTIVNHSPAAITAAGGTVNYSWSITPECLNCHDPHGDGSNRFMISREIYDEETGAFIPTGTPQAMPTEQLSLAFTDTTTGISNAGDSYADGDTSFSSICQECHIQTSGFVDDTSANYSGHAGFPGNPGDCGQCHKHDTGFTAGCAGCHAYPPTSGAHQAHAATAGGKPEFNCETCHGPDPGTATWHNESDVSTYDPDANFANVTLSSDLNTTSRGAAENAYYYTTWTRSGAVAPSVNKAAAYAFECSNVYCHGLDSVTWTWNPDATDNPANAEGYRTCGGCHGIAGDIDGDGTIDTASFRSRSGTLYQATNTAVNYLGPLSLFSRGGHGDTLINDAQWFEDTAPAKGLPLACIECHDSAADHFPPASTDRYRVGTVTISDATQTDVTNLCIRCHTEETDYHFLEVPKHPSDNFDIDWSAGVSRSPVLVTEGSMSVFTTNDPANVSGVGTHIDQYVDHWQYWGPPATGDTGDDYTPFLPMGDSLDPAFNANNTTADRVTCITCHNPHGTDLFVNGETPGVASTGVQIPANKMLRMRDADGELCSRCHN